jgi:hypothetical protein
MKNNSKNLVYTLMLIMFSFKNINLLSGQERVNLSVGVGFPETFNIGIRYQLHQSQVGLCFGMWPPSSGTILFWKSLISFSGDYYYHFGGLSEFSDLRPWYLRIGLNCLRINWGGSDINNNLGSYIRIGRDFYLSRDTGISLDAGLGLPFNSKTTDLSPIFPAIGGCFFYRF